MIKIKQQMEVNALSTKSAMLAIKKLQLDTDEIVFSSKDSGYNLY
jgi:hypothetical protein